MNHGRGQQANARVAVLLVVPLERLLAEGAAVLDAADATCPSATGDGMGLPNCSRMKSPVRLTSPAARYTHSSTAGPGTPPPTSAVLPAIQRCSAWPRFYEIRQRYARRFEVEDLARREIGIKVPVGTHNRRVPATSLTPRRVTEMPGCSLGVAGNGSIYRNFRMATRSAGTYNPRKVNRS
jgi:hypothetical protein